MKAIFKSIIVGIAIILIMFPSLLHAFDGKVVGVSDGDTIKVLKLSKS